MTEAEARAALRAFAAAGEVERWIAERRWAAVPGGWRVRLDGWRFRVERAPGGVRVTMSATGGGPATWFVPAA